MKRSTFLKGSLVIPISTIATPSHASNKKQSIDAAMNELLRIVPGHGSYVSESSFFEKDWQQSYWGSNYQNCLKSKNNMIPKVFSLYTTV